MNSKPFLLFLFLAIANSQAQGTLEKTQLGVAHIGGHYALTENDYLNEGADAILELGARCIKINLSLEPDNPPAKIYPFNSDWPEVATLSALAATSYYRQLFSKPFDTVVLNTFRPDKSGSYWREGFTAEDEHAEEASFADLTRYLLRTYAETEKTFILQNWEGDWALRGNFDRATIPTFQETTAMIRWLAARQRGVEKARAEFPEATAKVFHACEVNLVLQAIESNAPSVTRDVLPNVSLDLVSYSAWDTKNAPQDFGRALDFIAQHHRSTGAFTGHPIYVGEFGLPESEGTPEEVLARTQELYEIAKNKGAPYVIFWQIYCNEVVNSPPQSHEDYKGFWLIRPDGSFSLVCDMFRTGGD